MNSNQKLSREEFYDYMQKNIIPMNAKIGFWMDTYYNKYKHGDCTFEEAFKDLSSMRNYNV